MRILVTGADGMLGSCLMRRLSGHRLVPLLESECDIADPAAVSEALGRARPEAVIHTAAMTNVEACEADPLRTFAVNAGGTENLVRAAGPEALFVHISSTGIYGTGRDDPWTEEDEVHPTTVHHRAKYEAEQAVAAGSPRHLVLRVGWLFGAAPGHPRNFVVQRCREAEGREFIYADASQTGNPTWTANIAAQLQLLLDRGVTGLFNCTDQPPATRMAWVAAILELAGRPCRVEPAPSGHFRRAAPVSPNEAAVNRRLAAAGLERMGRWRDSLARYMETLGLR